MRFVVAVTPELLTALNERVAAERKRERDWLISARTAALRDAAGRSERLAALEGLRQARAQMRADGHLLGSRDAVLTWELRRVLADRGWDREWQAPPLGSASAPGRRWGISASDERGGTARLALDLPDELGEKVRRAAFWSGVEAQSKLADAHQRRRVVNAAEARQRARREVVTVGDVIREAARRAAQPA